MPKNSRPDIQVLEARVQRLKAQLLEYTDIRTYEITKQRLATVALELEECISIISNVVERDLATVPHKVALKEPEELRADEFEDDGDLSDVLFMAEEEASGDAEALDKEKPKHPRPYSPKYIISHYANLLKDCADTPTGVVQINQLCLLLNSWFTARFTPEVRNPHFYYRSERIHEWIDLIILYAGQALHNGAYPEFISYMNEWISTLNTSKDENWILPLKVRQVKESAHPYTKEAVVAERIIKKDLYSKDFYNGEKDAIARIVMKEEGLTAEEVKLQALLDDCPCLITTSSFDVQKYK